MDCLCHGGGDASEVTFLRTDGMKEESCHGWAGSRVNENLRKLVPQEFRDALWFRVPENASLFSSIGRELTLTIRWHLFLNSWIENWVYLDLSKDSGTGGHDKVHTTHP